VWTLGADDSEYYAALDDAELLARLQEKFGGRLGRLKRIGSRALYPLSLRVAQEQIRPGLVLLGNVAHTLHPVAGQGMNLSLRDIEALVEALSDIQDEGLGSMATLQRYLAAREADQSLMISVTDGLTKLFSSDAQTKVWLRKAGLLSIDLIPALKKTFGARAMGFD
jgi:2-octaprenyl-6-methoxyphenol hydroxylase